MEETIKDNKVVDLRDNIRELVVLAKKEEKLVRGTINCQVLHMSVFHFQHCLEQDLSTPNTLSRLMNVEVQDAERIQLMLNSLLVIDKKLLLANLQKSNDLVRRKVAKKVD